jgi:SAM-dependent methyltransferase
MIATIRRFSRRATKHDAELQHWRGEITRLREWFVDGSADWWGLPAPREDQKVIASDVWQTNAILTMHQLRPAYWEELQLEGDAFTRRRVLEVGCGPLAPVLQFQECERHGIDPLIGAYIKAGWPLYDLDVTFIDGPGEGMPYPDAWFDAVISVNALDHVDNFQAVAKEIQRVLKPGGTLRFEVEYHEPTVTEPIRLDDQIVVAAFPGLSLRKLRDLGAADLYSNLVKRFGLRTDVAPQLGSNDRYVLWAA